MSPLPVRRYRAERLLRKEFESLRRGVLATVRGRLRAAGVSLDAGDLEACYAQAWHGLYTTMLERGEEIANPAGWLALVTYRRAIDEQRARRTRTYDTHEPSDEIGAPERDLAGELDDRIRLRRLLEGLRGRLTPRERQAAALCYLQGLSRADAAVRMGIGEARMRKLMDGPSAGAPGVAGKVGELLDTIREGAFCAEQASLMRGFAYGILDPDGERHALAVAHWRECSACRRYVLSLRGLAAVLPPPPLPLALGAGMAAGAGASAAGAGAGASAAGAGGAAGGGWVLAGGGLGAKLAVGCLVAVSVGAGCVALTGVPIVPHHVPTVHHRHAARQDGHGLVGADVGFSSLAGGVQTLSSAAAIVHAGAARAGTSSVLTPADKASREFGLGQLASGVVPLGAKPEVTHAVYASRATHTARAASSSPSSGFEVVPASAHPAATSSDAGSSSGGSTGSSSAAQREFGLG